MWLSTQNKKRGRFLSQTLWGYRKVTARWEWSSWDTDSWERKDSSWVIPPLQQQKKQPGNGKGDEAAQCDKRWEHFQSNESCPPAWVQHPTCNSNIPFFSEALETDISKPSSSKSFMLLSSFLGIKTCTDFGLSQEVTKVTSNNHLTTLVLRFLLHPKSLEGWHWFNST